MADSATPKTEPSKPQSWPGHGSSTVPVQQFSLIVSMDSVENVNFLIFFAVLMVLFLEWLNQPLQKQTRLKYCNCAQSWPGHGSSIAPVQQFSFIVLMDSIENVNFLSFLWF